MSEGAELQFENAEFDGAPHQAECADCSRPLSASYYDVNGRSVCEACRYTIQARSLEGPGIAGFLRALGAGAVAAGLGAALYYGVGALTGYEFGLIAIVVGFGVGSAVRWGSNARGGWAYQALAIVLTYLSIVVTYIPAIVQGFDGAAAESAVVEAAAPGAAADGVASAEPAVVNVQASSGPDASPASNQMGLGTAMLILLAIACAAPFLGGMQNIIGIVIIGIGLYEAWKLNRYTELVITGPHVLSPAPPQPGA